MRYPIFPYMSFNLDMEAVSECIAEKSPEEIAEFLTRFFNYFSDKKISEIAQYCGYEDENRNLILFTKEMKK